MIEEDFRRIGEIYFEKPTGNKLNQNILTYFTQKKNFRGKDDIYKGYIFITNEMIMLFTILDGNPNELKLSEFSVEMFNTIGPRHEKITQERGGPIPAVG